MDAARVDLLASVAGKVGGVTWHHLFIVAADASGKQAYLRAGPQCLPLEWLSGRQTQYGGDAAEDYEPSPEAPYGAITFSTGAYEPGGMDFDPVAANVTLATGGAAALLWDGLLSAAKALGEERVAYDPVGTGANWALMEALRRCDVQAALPPKRWAPGASAAGLEPAAPGGSSRRIGQAVVL
jgi:hypothetical protein